MCTMNNTLLPMTLLSPMLANTNVNRIRKQLMQELKVLKQELDSLPEGSLYITKNRRWVSFYLYRNGRSRGITSDESLIYSLARRQYLTLLIRFLEDLLMNIGCDLSSNSFSRFLSELENLFHKFEKGKLDIDRITMTANQFIWNSDRQSQKPTRREELIYPTIGRVYMRTKSEQTLGNLLERLHIPYRYETTVRINGIPYHPDFIIMLPNGRLIIIEHVGRMDLDEYNDRLVTRLKAYDSIGLLIGRDVFFTFERDTRDESIAKEVLYQAFVSTPSDNQLLKKVAMKAGCSFPDKR